MLKSLGAEIQVTMEEIDYDGYSCQYLPLLEAADACERSHVKGMSFQLVRVIGPMFAQVQSLKH